MAGSSRPRDGVMACYRASMVAMATQATTIRLPKDLYERLRREAFDRHTSQTAIVTEILNERYKRIDGESEGAR